MLKRSVVELLWKRNYPQLGTAALSVCLKGHNRPLEEAVSFKAPLMNLHLQKEHQRERNPSKPVYPLFKHLGFPEECLEGRNSNGKGLFEKLI